MRSTVSALMFSLSRTLSSARPSIKRIEPTPEEREDNDQLGLQRIAFGFNRRDYGRLRQLIDVLNKL